MGCCGSKEAPIKKPETNQKLAPSTEQNKETPNHKPQENHQVVHEPEQQNKPEEETVEEAVEEAVEEVVEEVEEALEEAEEEAEQIDRQELFDLIYYYTNQQVNEDNYVSVFQQIFPSVDQDSDMMAVLKAENLVKNSHGQEQFENWNIEGCQDIIVEDWGTYHESGSVFVGSNQWTALTQTLEVSEYTGRTYVAGIAYTRRQDCGAVAQLSLSFDVDVQFESEQLVCTNEEDELQTGFCSKYSWFWTNGTIPDNSELVDIQVKTKDTQFWGGNYGARIGEIVFKVI